MNDTVNNIPHMETIKRTAEIFGLPVHFIRCKVASGEVVAVRAGRKFLVNIDRFAEYLPRAAQIWTALHALHR